MKIIFKSLLIILISYSSISIVYSKSDDPDVRTACRKHSIEVIKTLRQEIFTEMTEDEIMAALKISKLSCRKYFGDTELVAKKTTDEITEEKTTASDWFSEYVLHGDPHSKKGVKRLKKRH